MVAMLGKGVGWGRCSDIGQFPNNRFNPSLCTFSPGRFDRIAHTKETMRFDGLNSLAYKVLTVQRDPLYTKITVDIGTPR